LSRSPNTRKVPSSKLGGNSLLFKDVVSLGTSPSLDPLSKICSVPNGARANVICFHPVSNWGPFACEANVITTTLWKQITLCLYPFGTEQILESGSSEGLVPRQTTSLNKRLFPRSFELGTFRVLGERDNHYTMETDNTGPWPVWN